MNRADKQKIIDSIKADIEKSSAVFLTNLVGVKSSEAVGIRKAVRDVKGKIYVTRNALFQKAGLGTNAELLLKDLKGPHALAFTYDDPAALAKCLKDANKMHDQVVELKGGVLDGRLLSKNDVVALASLPSKEIMLGTLLATFNAPISALARVFHAIKEQKEAAVAN